MPARFLSILALLFATFLHPHASAETFEAPLPVDQYVPSEEPVMEIDEPSQEELRADLEEMGILEQDPADAFRMSFSPAAAAGKVIITIHKSSNPKRAEFLEIQRQNSASVADRAPVSLFDGGKSNRALVSTAGVHFDKKRGIARQYLTPEGTFGVDWQEKLHVSKTYENAPMPWSTFFAWDGAVAIHGATPSEFKDLGRNASHGCVRMHPTNAQLLYNLVQKVGKQNVIIQVLGG